MCHQKERQSAHNQDCDYGCEKKDRPKKRRGRDCVQYQQPEILHYIFATGEKMQARHQEVKTFSISQISANKLAGIFFINIECQIFTNRGVLYGI